MLLCKSIYHHYVHGIFAGDFQNIQYKENPEVYCAECKRNRISYAWAGTILRLPQLPFITVRAIHAVPGAARCRMVSGGGTLIRTGIVGFGDQHSTIELCPQQ